MFDNRDMREREETMQRDVLMVATAGASLLNGQSWSPFFDPAFLLLRPFVAQLVTSPLLLAYLTSIFISLLTLLIAGIPAALYERANSLKDSNTTSLLIWLFATLLLTGLPLLLFGRLT